jgi:hypothetical protein
MSRVIQNSGASTHYKNIFSSEVWACPAHYSLKSIPHVLSFKMAAIDH